MTVSLKTRPVAKKDLRAFCRRGRFLVRGGETGPLSGLSFAVKDLFDVAGHTTGAGNPCWLATHEPAKDNALVIETLLEAGATLHGKTVTDELAYSLMGMNAHYGTPANPAAPDRLPGGSSSGSAAAVAGRAVTFALGTDTGGSVRIPASYCGLFGMRPTHGRIPIDGVVPLAPSFDTVGWFARDMAVLERVGSTLLPGAPSLVPDHLLIAEDAFALADDATREALMPFVDRLAHLFARCEPVTLAGSSIPSWSSVFSSIQAFEAWQTHGAWIERNGPAFGPGIRDRFARAATVPRSEAEEANRERNRIRERVNGILGTDGLVCVPTAPGPAPLRTASEDDLGNMRARILALTCISGLAGVPQITLPLAAVDGAPVGLSLIGPPNSDIALMTLVRRIVEEIV